MKMISPELIERLKVVLMKSSSSHFTWEYIYNVIHELENLPGIPEHTPEDAQKEPTKVPKPKDEKKG